MGDFDQAISDKIGVDLDTLNAMREQRQDDTTRGLINLIKQTAVPRLLRAGWQCRYDGDDGIGCYDHGHRGFRLIHSVCREDDGEVWAHCSFSRRDRVMPTWEQTRDLYRLVYPDLAGMIVIPPESNHVNIAEVAHVWVPLTRNVIPDFTGGTGSI